jgi:hypothetical protein
MRLNCNEFLTTKQEMIDASHAQKIKNAAMRHFDGAACKGPGVI